MKRSLRYRSSVSSLRAFPSGSRNADRPVALPTGDEPSSNSFLLESLLPFFSFLCYLALAQSLFILLVYTIGNKRGGGRKGGCGTKGDRYCDLERLSLSVRP